METAPQTDKQPAGPAAPMALSVRMLGRLRVNCFHSAQHTSCMLPGSHWLVIGSQASVLHAELSTEFASQAGEWRGALVCCRSMPKVLPRDKRGLLPAAEDTAFLPDLFAKTSADVKGLQSFVEELDEEPIQASLQEGSYPLHNDQCKRKRQGPTLKVCTPAFDLAEVWSRLDAFIQGEDGRMELAPYAASQRKQVAMDIIAEACVLT